MAGWRVPGGTGPGGAGLGQSQSQGQCQVELPGRARVTMTAAATLQAKDSRHSDKNIMDPVRIPHSSAACRLPLPSCNFQTCRK